MLLYGLRSCSTESKGRTTHLSLKISVTVEESKVKKMCSLALINVVCVVIKCAVAEDKQLVGLT
jgi:hypothetical protein